MVIVFLTLGGISTRDSFACMCSGSNMILKLKLLEGTASGDDSEWHKSYSGTIFMGRVTGIKKEKAGESSRSVYRVRVTFEVESYWKGVADREAVVYTSPPSNGSCGYRFRKGQRYIVFAEELENRLVTSICSLTAESRYATNIMSGVVISGRGNRFADERGVVSLTHGRCCINQGE